MLRNIPACISPDLMHALMTMGHGDEIVLADRPELLGFGSLALLRRKR
jgi:L-fucose mutarotase/ribose pyranase (RbsD/FucU family)